MVGVGAVRADGVGAVGAVGVVTQEEGLSLCILSKNGKKGFPDEMIDYTIFRCVHASL